MNSECAQNGTGNKPHNRERYAVGLPAAQYTPPRRTSRLKLRTSCGSPLWRLNLVASPHEKSELSVRSSLLLIPILAVCRLSSPRVFRSPASGQFLRPAASRLLVSRYLPSSTSPWEQQPLASRCAGNWCKKKEPNAGPIHMAIKWKSFG